MKNTTRIYEVIFNSKEPVTLNAIKTALDMKPGICSGSLASLLKSGQIERVQLTAEKHPKGIWYGENTEAYLVAVNSNGRYNYRTIAVKVGE